jgi:hypothetical protein
MQECLLVLHFIMQLFDSKKVVAEKNIYPAVLLPVSPLVAHFIVPFAAQQQLNLLLLRLSEALRPLSLRRWIGKLAQPEIKRSEVLFKNSLPCNK